MLVRLWHSCLYQFSPPPPPSILWQPIRPRLFAGGHCGVPFVQDAGAQATAARIQGASLFALAWLSSPRAFPLLLLCRSYSCPSRPWHLVYRHAHAHTCTMLQQQEHSKHDEAEAALEDEREKEAQRFVEKQMAAASAGAVAGQGMAEQEGGREGRMKSRMKFMCDTYSRSPFCPLSGQGPSAEQEKREKYIAKVRTCRSFFAHLHVITAACLPPPTRPSLFPCTHLTFSRSNSPRPSTRT